MDEDNCPAGAPEWRLIRRSFHLILCHSEDLVMFEAQGNVSLLENIFSHTNETNGYQRLILLETTRICRFGLVSVPEPLHVQLCRASCSEVSLEEDTMRARRGRRCLRPLQLWKRPHQRGTALVNIIGSWCMKLTVPVRSPRATSPTKPSRAALHRREMFDGGGAT